MRAMNAAERESFAKCLLRDEDPVDAVATALGVAAETRVDQLRNLLRDVYDVTSAGAPISEGLLSRIRREMARGN